MPVSLIGFGSISTTRRPRVTARETAEKIRAGCTTLGFWQYAELEPDKTALVAPSGRVWSRGALLREANRVSHALRANGLKRGDRVALMLPNCVEFLAFYLAVTQIGLYLVSINIHLTGPEVRYILEDSGAKVFVVHPRAERSARSAIEAMAVPVPILVSVGAVNGFRPLESWLEGTPGSAPGHRRTGDVLSYTSGTTGRPKGVLRALPNITPEAKFVPFTAINQKTFAIASESGNVHFVGCPLYHAAPLMWASLSLHMGHALAMVDKWDAEEMLRLIERWRVTTSQMVPTQFVRLLKLPSAIRGRYDVSSLTHVFHGGAPCPPDVKWAMLQWWGPVVCEVYAATEGGGTSATPHQWMAHPGTVGMPWFKDGVRILDDEGRDLPPGRRGTVYLLMSEGADFEYMGDPEKTQAERRGRYFTVGDIGYLDSDGFLFLSDRKRDVIISGGANIYPVEVEGTLIMHPGVADCAVFGIPNREWGEEVKAVIQPAVGIAPGNALTCDLLQFLEGRVAKPSWPKSIDYVVELPRDPNGKLLKRHLREPYWREREQRI